MMVFLAFLMKLLAVAKAPITVKICIGSCMMA
jgi:hypothetical protein